jgi:acetate kinase
MGMTPLEGLVMGSRSGDIDPAMCDNHELVCLGHGSRSGDIDPAILDFISNKEGLTLDQVEILLNKHSGLLGISGLTNDMRELLEEARENDDRRARLAIEIFCYRVRKYIGAYLAAMNGADALIFTGGIGENAAEVRARITDGLQWLGVELDAERNAAHTGGREGLISTDGSRLAVYVIPTDEELLIARDTVRLVRGSPQRF